MLALSLSSADCGDVPEGRLSVKKFSGRLCRASES